MELEGAAFAQPMEPDAGLREPPHATEWLWRPWYAKLWWSAIVIYWGGRLLALFLPTLALLYENALAGVLNILFFPPTLLIVLGIGFVGAWMDHYRWEWVASPDAGLHPRRSVGGYLDPVVDPLDPRSSKFWHRAGHGRSVR
jgi:hypothetical protein